MTSKPQPDNADFLLAWSIIWRNKLPIIFSTAIFAVASVAYALSLPNIYRSTVSVISATESNSNNLLSQVGSIVGLAGGSLPSNQPDKTDIAIEVLQSRDFLRAFIDKHQILPELMATKEWDQENNQIIYDTDLYDFENNKWIRDVTFPKTVIPSDQEAYEQMSTRLFISKDKKTGIIKINIDFYSPYVAQEWAKALVDDINDYMREQDKIEAQRSIDYLEQQLEKTSITGMQTVFYQLIEEQTKTMMLTESRKDYIFKTIDSPIAPEEKLSPKRSLICLLGTAIGGILGLLIALIKHAIKNSNNREFES